VKGLGKNFLDTWLRQDFNGGSATRNIAKPGSLHDWLSRESTSGLDQLKHLTARAKASGGEPAKSTGAAVERYREVPLYEAALLTVDPADDAPKSFKRALEF
jgi:hypothetical protein